MSLNVYCSHDPSLSASAHKELSAIVTSPIRADSLEQLFYPILRCPGAELTLLRDPEEPEFLIVSVSSRGSMLAILKTDWGSLKKLYRTIDITKIVARLDDKSGFVEDEEWLNKRDKMFHIRFDAGSRYATASVSAFGPMVLAYCNSGYGSVTIAREYGSYRRLPQFCWLAKFAYVSKTDEYMLSESLLFSEVKMEEAIARRISKN